MTQRHPVSRFCLQGADVICKAGGIDVACQHHTPPTHHASLLSLLSFPTDNNHFPVEPMYAHVYIPTHTHTDRDRKKEKQSVAAAVKEREKTQEK